MSLIGVESGVTPRSIPTGVSRVFRGRSIRFTDGNGIKFQVYDDNGSAYIMADVNPLIINHPPNPCPPIEPAIIPPPSIEIVSYTSASDFRIEFLVDSSTDSVVVSQNGTQLFTILPDQFGNFILDSSDGQLPSGTYEAYRVVDSETSPHISFAVNATCLPDLSVSLAIRYQPEEETELFIIVGEVIDELEYSLDYGDTWTDVSVVNIPFQYPIQLPYEGDYTIYPRGSIIIRATRDGVTRDVALDQGTISPGIIAIDNIEVVESIARLRLHSIPDSVIMVSINDNMSPSVNTNSCGQAELSVNLTECGVTYQVCLTTLELADYSRCKDLSIDCPPVTDGRLIMGFEWAYIGSPSAAHVPRFTVIDLLPSTSYTLLDITSYA